MLQINRWGGIIDRYSKIISPLLSALQPSQLMVCPSGLLNIHCHYTYRVGKRTTAPAGRSGIHYRACHVIGADVEHSAYMYSILRYTGQ
jgi:hypothetical protein